MDFINKNPKQYIDSLNNKLKIKSINSKFRFHRIIPTENKLIPPIFLRIMAFLFVYIRRSGSHWLMRLTSIKSIIDLDG